MQALASGPPVRHIVLSHDADFDGFRRAARDLLATGTRPEQVSWSTGEATLFDPAAPEDSARDADASNAVTPSTPSTPSLVAGAAPEPFTVPRALLATLSQAALHEDAQRFALLYRLLWRWAHESALRGDPLDADLMRVQRMAQAVRRDLHKMKAFVRFRPVHDDDGALTQVAWFEPAHHTVAAVAPFFARRFATLRWALLTPRGSARWDPALPAAERLALGPPARRGEAPPPDAGEALWLAYYRSIFNPARLKLSMMRKEMPRRYWPNLPEAALISRLAAEATTRTGHMIEQPASTARRTVRLLPARAAPVRIDSLDDLRAATARCRECPIGEHATQAVCGEGPLAPALMLVGEQPGDHEDLHGRPFVGPAGQWLAQALEQVGLTREQVYLANAVKHFKFELRGKRRIHKSAGQREAMACAHWLDDEIRLVRPRALVALGATAARALLGGQPTVAATRGRWLARADGLPVLVTLHPSALLRMEPAQRASEQVQWLADLALAARGPGDTLQRAAG